MGIAFITAKAKRYENQRDAAYEEELASENLLSSLPDKINPTFRCRALEELPNVGEGVLLDGTSQEIKVVLYNKPIGIVMSPDASEARGMMNTANSEALAGVVSEVRLLTRIFIVKISN